MKSLFIVFDFLLFLALGWCVPVRKVLWPWFTPFTNDEIDEFKRLYSQPHLRLVGDGTFRETLERMRYCEHD